MASIEPGTHAIVLAAGAARRFGGGKLCSPFRGRPLVTWAVEAALATRAEGVTIVLGADAEKVERVLSPLRDERLRTIVAPDWNGGLSHSLGFGVANLPPETRALLLFLGDMPLVSSALADRLLLAVLDGAPAAMPVFDGTPAHPVAVANTLVPALLDMTGDRGARAVLHETPGAVTLATEDEGSIFDVDRPEDLDEAAPPVRNGIRIG